MNPPNYDLSDPDAVAFCPLCGAGYTARATKCADCQQPHWPRSRVEEHLASRHERAGPSFGAGFAAAYPPVELETLDVSDPESMWFCPTCGPAYEEAGFTCNKCNAPLLPRSWIEQQLQERAIEQQTPGAATVCLCRVAGPIKVGRLEDEWSQVGIPFSTRILGATGTGLDRMEAEVDFFVLEDDLERAAEILAGIEEPSDS